MLRISEQRFLVQSYTIRSLTLAPCVDGSEMDGLGLGINGRTEERSKATEWRGVFCVVREEHRTANLGETEITDRSEAAKTFI